MRLTWLLLIGLAGALTGYLFTRFEGTAPDIETAAGPVYMNGLYTHELRFGDEDTGLESTRIWIESGDQEYELSAERYPGNLFTGAAMPVERRISVDIDPGALTLPEGPAELVAEARDFSWRGNVSLARVDLVVDTRAPRISLQTGLTYARRGGAELVVYRVPEDAVSHGVRVGDDFFPGYAHPSQPGLMVALYAIAPDAPTDARPALIARDRAGNESTAGMTVEILERGFDRDTIGLSRGFMERKVGELLDDPGDDLLGAYLKINRDMRESNAAQLAELASRASVDPLWTGAFLQLPNSSRRAGFGEKRRYLFEGAEVDRQTHLGLDLASTSRAVVPAANDGVVAWADELGIYGQAVAIDHGLGLFSLYGHLSEISVEVGDAVNRGDAIGRTGATGLAGGDHLHFSILVHGVFVDPLEWLDRKWLRDHIDPKLES